MSMRTIEREFNVQAKNVRGAGHEDLGLKSSAFRRTQLLTKKQVEYRLAQCHTWLNDIKYETHGILCFFSDKKNFNLHQKVNARNG